jgi:hypothetical protein
MGGERLFVLCGDPVRLFQVSTLNGSVLREFALPEELDRTGGPCGLALHRRDLFVAKGKEKVFVLDSNDGSLRRVLDVSREYETTGAAYVAGEGLLLGSFFPSEEGFSKGGGALIADNQYVSPADGSPIRPFITTHTLDGWGAGPLGRLFAWNYFEPGLEEVDEITGVRTGFVSSTSILAEGGNGFAYSGRNLFFAGVANELIKVIDPQGQRVLRAFPAPVVPVCGLAAGPIEPDVLIRHSDEFPIRLAGSFRSRVASIDEADLRMFQQGQPPEAAQAVRLFDYSGQHAAEVFDATLTPEDFPAPNGIFHFIGVATDTQTLPVTTPEDVAVAQETIVILDNLPPLANLIRPVAGELLSARDYAEGTTSFPVTGFFSDPLSGLRSVSLYAQRPGMAEPVLVETRDLPPSSLQVVEFLWNPPEDGDYELFLTAVDLARNETHSQRVPVQVFRDFIEPEAGDPLPTLAERIFSASENFSEILSTVTIAELDGDPEAELVFGTDRTNSNNPMNPHFEILKDDAGMGLFAINLDGTPVPGVWPVILDVDVRASPAVEDFDNDGLDEIVVGTYAAPFGVSPATPSGVRIYDHNGIQLGRIDTAFSVLSSAAIGNLDEDPGLEAVVGTSDGTLLAFEADGTPINLNWPILLPSRPDPIAPRNDVDSSPALGDLNGDGVVEIAVLTDDGALYVYQANGQPLPGFPFFAPANTFSLPLVASANFSSPVIADVDGDGQPEVVTAMTNGRVYALNPDGSMVAGYPLRLPPDADPMVLAPDPGDEILSTPALGDIDNDGLLEMAVTFYRAASDETRLFVYDLPALADCEKMPWPTFQQSTLHRGVYAGPANGDVRRDGIVNTLDQLFFETAWYRHSTMPKYRAELDFDYSKRIDAIDLLAFLGLIQDGTGEEEPPLGTGDVQVTLTWDTNSDIDLYVRDPNGDVVYFGNTQVPSGGRLDRDDIGACDNRGGAGMGPENVFWPDGMAPTGEYAFSVDYFSGCPEDVPTHWQVVVKRSGQPDQFFEGLLEFEGQTTEFQPFVFEGVPHDVKAGETKE